MAVTIRLRRGTNKAQLDSYGPLQLGEPCFLMEEGVVYVGDGTSNYMIGQVASGIGNPTGSGPPGRMYVDTTSSGIWFYEASVGWMEVGSNITDLSQLTGTLDDIADGTSYQRVAASEVDSSGYVIRINDGTYQVTASGGYTHINDATLHRIINDLGTSNVELWSSQKINDTISSVSMGIDWQDSVLDKDFCEPPGSPSDGDRYIICPTASGAWSGYSNYVVEYMTSSGGWVYVEPNKGFASYVEDESKIYLYNGTTWGPISDITLHNDLSGLQGGAAGEYYHFTATQHTDLTDGNDSSLHYHASDRNRANHTGTQTASTISDWDSALQTTISGMVSGNTETGIIVSVNADKLDFVVDFCDTNPTNVAGGVSASPGTSEKVSRCDHTHALGGHGLLGSEHTMSGLTPGNFLEAATATSAQWTGTVDGGNLT